MGACPKILLVKLHIFGAHIWAFDFLNASLDHSDPFVQNNIKAEARLEATNIIGNVRYVWIMINDLVQF